MYRSLLAAVFVAVVSTSATAQGPQRFVRDVAHSQINFVAESRMIDAHGTFDKWDAEIHFDPENISGSTVKITIDAKSINTRIEMRDNHLRSNDFFATDSFPTITFNSTIVNQLQDDRVNITGDLTIRGQTKAVTFPSRLMFFDPERNVGRIRGTVTIDRNDFGVAYNSRANPIAAEVQIQFDIAFQVPRS